MDNLIFHIGSDKAGSTAIQMHLFGNREWLLERGFFLPNSFFNPSGGHSEAFLNFNTDKLDSLAQEIQQNRKKCNTAIISFEGLHFLERNNIHLVREHLPARNVKIIYYIREQSAVVQSGLLQRVKAGERKFIFPYRFPKDLDMPQREYDKVIQRWQSEFPEAQIDVVLYDRNDFHQGSVVYDFLSRIGLGNDGFTHLHQDANTSLDVPSAVALEQMSTSPAWFGYSRELLASYLLINIKLRGAGEKHFLEQIDVETIRDRFFNTNTNLIKQYQVSNHILDAIPSTSRDLVAYPDKAIIHRAQEIIDECKPLKLIPFYDFRERHTDGLLASCLAEGWFQSGRQRLWSKGGCSTIRFRIIPKLANPFLKYLKITIAGTYRNKVEKQTEITINQTPMGRFDLSSKTTFCLPTSELTIDLCVTITLLHRETCTPLIKRLGKNTEGYAIKLKLLDVVRVRTRSECA